MLVSDYVAQQGAANVYATVVSTPFWWPLAMAVKSPKDIVPTCKALGLNTVADVQAWIGACNTGVINNRDVWQSLVSPTASIKAKDLPTVAWVSLDDARFAQCASADSYQRLNSDANYLVPTEAQLRKLAKECPSWRYQYTVEKNDCDDFVSLARGWLASQGLGSLAVGKVATLHYQGAKLLYGHAVLLSFTQESVTGPLKAWWWEPQTGEIHDVSYTRLGANWLQFPDRVELAWGDF